MSFGRSRARRVEGGDQPVTFEDVAGIDEAKAELTEVTRLRAQLRAHPCHGCPDREDHARWADTWRLVSPGQVRRELPHLRVKHKDVWRDLVGAGRAPG